MTQVKIYTKEGNKWKKTIYNLNLNKLIVTYK